MFRKVLIANRGEIAVRIARALRELRIPSVAVYSDADRAALHVRMADEAVHIGAAPSSESYLSQEKILAAARRSGASAIHPGYGFLSENADFAAACEDAGLTFIGPGARSIRSMGSKTEARRLAEAAGTPVAPGTLDPLRSVEEAVAVSAQVGYPVMLKAAAGGGGKGMRRVDTAGALPGAFRDASSEAVRAFGNGALYVEKLIVKPRHIEIQVLGDRHGNLIHLGERECSLQRRHQKIVEECPSPFLASRPELRERMGAAAVAAARAGGYYNAGTVEFLVEESGNFYFLEMNTRLQVEHPVTELVTGVDLVHWQLRIAAGEKLDLAQERVQWRGAAIECRVYAEDPEAGFLPSPGTITSLAEPAGPGVRVDSGVYPGWTVPFEYDPLLAKLAVWGESRERAIRVCRRALQEYAVLGIRTNLALFEQILDRPEFCTGHLHTGLIEEWLGGGMKSEPASEEVALAMMLAAAVHSQQRPEEQPAPVRVSRWAAEGRSSQMR